MRKDNMSCSIFINRRIVYGCFGNLLGMVEDAFLDTDTWQITGLIINAKGIRHLVSMEFIKTINEHKVETILTSEQFKSLLVVEDSSYTRSSVFS